MSTPNLYWSVYKGLEKELLELSTTIHISDRQLDTFSVKIAGLLARTAFEIEAIAKDLYKKNGGSFPVFDEDGKERFLQFDTDCLNYLNKIWHLEKKVVNVACADIFLSAPKNISFRPLKDANKIGHCKWKCAYQAVKHSRNDNLEKGNLENFIHSLAALYLLNLYYKDLSIDIENDEKGLTIDKTCGSMVFSVNCNSGIDFSSASFVSKSANYEECSLILHPEKSGMDKLKGILINKQRDLEIETRHIRNYLAHKAIADDEVISHKDISEVPQNQILELDALAHKQASEMVNKRYGSILSEAMAEMQYEVVMNKNQF